MLEERLNPDEDVELYLGGGAAILLAYDGELATDDMDLIGEKTGVLLKLSELAGEGSDIHKRTNYYVDIVPPGLFPQDWGWRMRAVPVRAPGLGRLTLRVMEVHDLIVSKLKRFGGKDQQDIRALCARTDVDVDTLRARYREARLLRDHDEREQMDGNFNLVEMDFLGHEPTEFE